MNTRYLGKLLRASYLEHKTNDWVRSKISFHVDPEGPLLATVKRRNSHGSGRSRATTASPKPPYRAPWRLGDAVVDKEMLEGQRRRDDALALARIAYDGLPHKRLEEDLC